jgi:hypothetical protein
MSVRRPEHATPPAHHAHAHQLEGSHGGLSVSARRKAVASAVVAAGVALASVWLDALNREVMLTRDQASNSWSYFHQKSLKEKIYESELGQGTSSPARAAELRQSIDRYAAEGDEVRIKAESEEALLVKLLAKLHSIEAAVILLEIAIILFSISLIVPLTYLELAAWASALLGAVLAFASQL